MAFDVFLNVLYKVGLYGTIITLIIGIGILILKYETFQGISKLLCRLFIVVWVAYVITATFSIFTTKLPDNKADNAQKNSAYHDTIDFKINT